MKISTFFTVAAALCAALLFNGCASSKTPAKIQTQKTDKEITPPTISSAQCVLKAPRDVRAVAGTPCDVNVQLIYKGKKTIELKEWYMLDRNNFAVFYRRLPLDRTLKVKPPFKKYTPYIPAKPRPKHAILTLKPDNRAMLTVTLPFTGDLAPGEKAFYEAYIATSLVTFKIKSNLFNVYTY